MPAQKTVPQTAPPPPEELAEAPFDNARADLILQSSDEIHFRVHKNILSLASPVFADMFSLPSPSSQKPHDEVQVVTLSEHSTALDVALRHIYPVRTPKGDSLHYASILVEFARKYQVEALDRFITGYLTPSVERDPVGVYAIAITYGYNDIGAIAARSCLNLPFSSLRSQYLRCATAEHIAELFWYHAACGEAASASAVASSHIYLGDDDGRSREGRFRPQCSRKHLRNYLYRSAIVLAHHPTAQAITTEAFVLKDNNCPECAEDLPGHVIRLSAVLGREIN
jgi:hypothetical protein